MKGDYAEKNTTTDEPKVKAEKAPEEPVNRVEALTPPYTEDEVRHMAAIVAANPPQY